MMLSERGSNVGATLRNTSQCELNTTDAALTSEVRVFALDAMPRDA